MPDNTQQQIPPAPDVSSLPVSSSPVATPTWANATVSPDSLDLQQAASSQRQLLGNALQAQQQQLTNTQGQLDQAQAQLNSPLQTALQREADALQAQQPTSNRGGIMKRLLTGFFTGASDGMLHAAGLPTSQQQTQQHIANIATLSNAAALDSWRQAQTQAMQLVPWTSPNGDQVMIPQSEVAKLDASIYNRTQKPDLNDLIGRSVYSAIQRGVDPNTDPVVAQLLQIQRGMQKPPADTASTQKEQFMQGIQPMIAAGEFTPDMQTDVRKFVLGIQKSKAIAAAQKPALVAYLAGTNTPASAGTQAQFKIQLEDQNKQLPVLDTKQNNNLVYLSPAEINARNSMEPGRYIQSGQAAQAGKVGYAFDAGSGQVVFTNSAEAQQKNYQQFYPVTAAEVQKDRALVNQLNDVQINVSRYNKAAQDFATQGKPSDAKWIQAVIGQSGNSVIIK
jgi:hypothetical protein